MEDSTEKGLYVGAKVTGLRVVLLDGASHLVDSSEIAFRLAAQGAFQQGNSKRTLLLAKMDMFAIFSKCVFLLSCELCICWKNLAVFYLYALRYQTSGNLKFSRE